MAVDPCKRRRCKSVGEGGRAKWPCIRCKCPGPRKDEPRASHSAFSWSSGGVLRARTGSSSSALMSFAAATWSAVFFAAWSRAPLVAPPSAAAVSAAIGTAVGTAIAAVITTLFAITRTIGCRRRCNQAVLSSQAFDLCHQVDFGSCRRRCRLLGLLLLLLRRLFRWLFRLLRRGRSGCGGRGNRSFANHAEELVVVAAVDRVAVVIHRFDQGLELCRGVPQAVFHAVAFRLHAHLRLLIASSTSGFL